MPGFSNENPARLRLFFCKKRWYYAGRSRCRLLSVVILPLGLEKYDIFVDAPIMVLYYSTKLNNRQKKILEDVFTDPVKPNISWKDIENMPIALGAEVSEGSGSRVRFFMNNRIAVFHRPHPERVTDKGAVKSVREFIVNSGINIKDYL